MPIQHIIDYYGHMWAEAERLGYAAKITWFWQGLFISEIELRS